MYTHARANTHTYSDAASVIHADIELDDFLPFFLHLARTVHDGAANVVTDVGQLGRFVYGFQSPSGGVSHSAKPII